MAEAGSMAEVGCASSATTGTQDIAALVLGFSPSCVAQIVRAPKDVSTFAIDPLLCDTTCKYKHPLDATTGMGIVVAY